MACQHVPAPHLHSHNLLIDEAFDLNGPAAAQQEPLLPPPKVLVVGGSIGGCCAAIALGSALGCHVEVFERSSGALRSQGAGLVIQPDMAAFLQHFQVCESLEELAVQSSGRQYVARDGSIISGNTTPQLFSAWDVLHRALLQKVPQSCYHGGQQVSSLSAGSGGVSITLAEGHQVSGDLLIGADGPGSIVRSHFCPGVRSEYQGYLAWRGLVPEAEVPAHVLAFLGTKFTVFQGPKFHILAYLIPGEGGQIQAGERRVNWVWYWNHPEEGLDAVLTDIHGHRHGFSVPRGLLRPDVAAAQRTLARAALPPALADLVDATADIFVQAIHDMLAPSLIFQGRVALVGDAGCILRPHTAAGTTKAAINVWALVKALQQSGHRLPPALQQYDSAMMRLGHKLVVVGQTIGTRSQFPLEAGGHGRRLSE